MFKRKSIARHVCAAALLMAAGASQATIAVFTTSPAFFAAIGALASGTDSFDDLISGASYGGPLARNAGSFSYTVGEGPGSPVLKGAGSGTDTWLQTSVRTDTITFNGFGANVVAAGGDFFDSNFIGRNRVRPGTVLVTATDGDGPITLVLTNPTPSTFLGFVSNGQMLSIDVSMGSFGRATVNNLTLAAPVPEPETYAMLLSGLAAVGFVVARRRRR